MPNYKRKTTPHWGRIALVSGLALTAFAVSQAGDDEKDRGPKIERSYDLSGFDAIDISGVYDVEVEVGKSYSIRLEGPEREMAHARVEVDGDTLELGVLKKKFHLRNRSSIDAYITVPSLNHLDVSGVSDVDVDGISAELFKLNVTGVADINLSGRCNTLKANISGVSDVSAKKLECQDGKVDMSGVGDLSLYTSDSVDADVSGVGDVTVYGQPSQVEKSVSKYTASFELR